MNTCFAARKNYLVLVIPLALAGLALIVGFGCGSDGDGSRLLTSIIGTPGWGPGIEISGELISHSECIWFFAPVTETLVEWEYDGNGTLDLRHFAAGFNCCPELHCEVSVYDKTITVIERDSGNCFCLCLLEANYQVTGLPPGKYLLQFDEAVPIGDDEPLQCEILLKGDGSSGSCAVERTVYPWGGEGSTGELVSCELATCTCPWPNSGCAAWEYSEGALSLTHCNEYTSCCILGEPTVDFDFSSNTIVITENVEMGFLTLMVTVEIDMLISNLPPGEYLIKLNRFMDLEPVEFTVDLINEPSGEVGFD
ncbi:MAG: hypothetical protein JSV52_02525 [Candidatus Zixiibacteriota bacterium]|nr:MAG: hypothetical protein JSV52_02525 [candidate division Zixibacteria bacterium]